MVDTVSGVLGWQSPEIAGSDAARLMSVAGRHFLYLPGRSLLAVFGDDGQVHAARSLDGFGPVWPRQIQRDSIWVYRGDQWAVLDAATLTTRSGSGVDVAGVDVREEFARELD